MMDEIEADYNAFWRGIVETNGRLDPVKVKRELYDYHMVMREVSLVYDRLTGGQISKPNTEAETVIAVVEDRMNEDTDALTELQRARDELARCGISGIDAEFRDVADAVSQMARYIKQHDSGDGMGWQDTDAAPGEALDWPSDDVIAEVLERSELARELIAWAAEEDNALTDDSCRFCGASFLWVDSPHRDDCLHLRARALRGDDE